MLAVLALIELRLVLWCICIVQSVGNGEHKHARAPPKIRVTFSTFGWLLFRKGIGYEYLTCTFLGTFGLNPTYAAMCRYRFDGMRNLDHHKEIVY